jgi:hypothetical protein
MAHKHTQAQIDAVVNQWRGKLAVEKTVAEYDGPKWSKYQRFRLVGGTIFHIATDTLKLTITPPDAKAEAKRAAKAEAGQGEGGESIMFETVQVLRTDIAALCPQCRSPRFTFVRLSRSGMVCVPCAEKPLPKVTLADVEHPTRSLETVFRHGSPVVCTSCEKERTVFSRLSGLCVACTK